MLPSNHSFSRLGSPDAGWTFSLFPDAAEGSGVFRSSARRVPDYVARGAARDPERAAEEAGRRARRKLRRYGAANRLTRLGTLTYRDPGCHEPALIRKHLGEFFPALRRLTGGRPFPYVWVPEWHPMGHGLHAHFALGRYIRKSKIQRAWPHGFVHIKLIGDLPVGSSDLTEARIAAGYLSKYVAKTFLEPKARMLGLHRYEVAQGFQPRVVALQGSSSFHVLRQASELQGGGPTWEWSSGEVADWQGPPAISARWGR